MTERFEKRISDYKLKEKILTWAVKNFVDAVSKDGFSVYDLIDIVEDKDDTGVWFIFDSQQEFTDLLGIKLYPASEEHKIEMFKRKMESIKNREPFYVRFHPERSK